MATKLNDKQVKALLKAGKPGRHSVGHGLYLRISNEAAGFWVSRYTIHSKRREITLGRYPDISLAGATIKNAEIRQNVNEGIDPLAEKKRPDRAKIHTVNQLAEDWLATDIEPRLKHPHIPRRIYERDLAPLFGELALDRVSPRDIRAAINRVVESGRPTVANDALMYAKQLFRHGIRLDLMASNPADAFTVRHAGGIEQSRTRVLSIDELSAAFTSFREHANQFTRENYLALALLLVLGVRKGELVAARWAEFDADNAVWNLPEERSKTGVPISIPLPLVVLEWLEELHMRACGSEFVFPNRRSSNYDHINESTLNAALKKLFNQDKLTVEHFTVHDLRRTFRSLLASIGVPGHIAERCLNHKLKGVEGIYDRYDYFDERREAVNKVADLLAPVINPASNVTSFRRSA